MILTQHEAVLPNPTCDPSGLKSARTEEGIEWLACSEVHAT